MGCECNRRGIASLKNKMALWGVYRLAEPVLFGWIYLLDKISNKVFAGFRLVKTSSYHVFSEIPADDVF